MFDKKLYIDEDFEDLIRIKNFFFCRGIELTLKEANELWLDFSNGRCAGWLIVCNELLTDCFMEYVENWEKYYVYDEDNDCLIKK